MPDMTREIEIGGIVAGLDEVGRGPLCGDVIAAIVIIPDPALVDGPLKGLNDSKRLSERRLLSFRDAIVEHCVVSIGSASPREIDEINILQATFLAMGRAVAGLPGIVPDHILVDGNRVPEGLPCPATAVVKGDSKSCSIAAASIVAKVHRDSLMAALDAEFPGYGWARNAGYPTKEHYEAIARLGVTPHHRRSFKGVVSGI
jgi:ribonuclease HII